MAKRRKAQHKAQHKPADQRTAPVTERRSADFGIMGFAVTIEPLPEPAFAALSRATKTELQRLYHLARTNPRAAAPQLMAALMRYPQVPSIFNYLFVAFAAMGDVKRAEAIVLENLRLHPNYLFARVNYAEIFLVHGEPGKVPETLGEELDLKQLYPERDRFHVSEVVGFYGVVGFYYWQTGRPEEAARCYALLRQLDPQHKMTQRLKAKVQPSWWRRLWGGG
jgi:tetratricopeptide (TPR) repeat protein